MTDYVLVHGAWGGGWAYEQLSADLAAHGHRVVVAALTGLGTRVGEFHPGITLTTHVDDVCAQVAAAGFDRFVLVGHSWGGMVITGVATRLGARIDTLVYLDAFVPQDGEALWDYVDEAQRAYHINSQKHAPARCPPLEVFTELPEGQRRPLTDHPLLTFIEAVRYTGEEAKVPARVYVYATGWLPQPFGTFAQRLRNDPAWRFHELPCGHDVMGEKPQETLEILLGCGYTKVH